MYTVSIPVHWAKEHGIEKGNTAYLYTHRDGSLIIRRNEKEHNELATIEIELDSTDPDVTERMLYVAYKIGFKRIHLRNSEKLGSAQRRAIETCTRALTGVEITEDSDHLVTVQDLLDVGDVSIRQFTIQMQYIMLSMYEAALDFFAGKSTEFEYIVNRFDEVDRIFRLITRHFNRSLLDLTETDRLGITRSQLFEYYVMAGQFERIADCAVKIARCIQRTDYTVSEELVTETRAIGGNARQVVKEASTAVINGESTGKAHSVLDECEHIIQKARSLDRTLMDKTPEEAYILTRVLDSIICTVEYGGNVAELALRPDLYHSGT